MSFQRSWIKLSATRVALLQLLVDLGLGGGREDPLLEGGRVVHNDGNVILLGDADFRTGNDDFLLKFKVILIIEAVIIEVLGLLLLDEIVKMIILGEGVDHHDAGGGRL